MSRLPTVLVAPVALRQGRALQRDTPRLPEAHGARDGLIGGAASRTAKPLRLLVVGDSTAMGTGVPKLDQGLPGHLGRVLTARAAASATVGAAVGGAGDLPALGGVAWRAVGRNGATAAEVLAEFSAAAVAAHFDLAVVLVGWNDTLRLRAGTEFAHALGQLLDRLHAASPDARLVVVAPRPSAGSPRCPIRCAGHSAATRAV